MTMSIKDKWGKKRKAIKFNCCWCGKETIRRIWKNRTNKFCSRNCYSLSSRKEIEVTCAFCNKIFLRKLSKVRKINFCNRECKELLQSGEAHPNWKGGFRSYRNRGIKEYGFKCSNKDKCLLKGIHLPDIAFDVDHIDGDRNNNDIKNLQVLCLLCHRQKTFKLYNTAYSSRSRTAVFQAAKHGALP